MKGNKGITLIALVITIIVLLILAGISIAMLSGSNGIFGKATDAKTDNDIGTAKDECVLLASDAIATYYKDQYVDNYTTSSSNAGVQAAVITAINNKTISNVTITCSPAGEITLAHSNGKTVTGSVDANGAVSWN